MHLQVTADAFLEALDLPSEYPYTQSKDYLFEHPKQEWSISSYFSSWKDSQTSSIAIGPNECQFPSPSWTRRKSSHDDSIEDACRGNSVAATTRQSPISSPSEVNFFEEIKPCIVSMLHMNIIIWAPLVIIVCLKRLYFPRRSPLETLSGQKKSFIQNSGYFIAIPTLPKCMPSLRKKATVDGKQRGQTPEPCQNNGSFERLLLSLSIFLNAISVMSSFSAICSIEEKKKEGETSNLKEIDVVHEETKDGCLKRYCRARSSSISNDAMSQGPFTFTSEWAAYVVALIFTSFLMNDAMYVLAFPQTNLAALHLFAIYVSLKRFGSRVALMTALPISTIAFYIMACQDLDLPTIEPGLYYDESNAFISEAVSKWPVDKRTYEDGTPWMLTGDTRTGLPFMVNKVPTQSYIRRWVPLPEENEAIILDIAFPDSMVIDGDKRVYLVLHGINGDSNEGYVVDFVHRQVSRGNVVAVMVTRGLGDSTITGDNILHFSRISDLGAAARALRKAINIVNPDGLLLAGVGYSMGAITLANFVASDPKCDLDVAVAFSGALDTKQQMYFHRSAHLWQPFIAKAMRDTLLSRFSRQIRNKLGPEQLEEMMKAKSLLDFDRALFVHYNDFESLDDYYYRMGAMADYDSNGYEGRISNVSIPLLCVQSIDDPIGYWKTFHDPSKVSKSGNGYTVLLFTATGGHVGWPLGWNPSVNGWRWMSDAASSFAESVDQVRRHKPHGVHVP